MRKNQVILGVLAALAATASQASTFPEFKVNPTQFNQSVFTSSSPLIASSTGTFGNIFTANQIAGNYNEIVTFDGLGNFSVSLRFNATSFNLVDVSGTTTPTGTGLNSNDPASVIPGVGSQKNTGYGLYALLTGTGTVSAGATGPVLNLNSGGTINLFADDNVDTAFSNPLNGTLQYGRTNFSDDKLLATGAVITGQGSTKPCSTGPGQTDCGSFGQTTTFSLTPVGKTFFIDPAPQFYSLTFESGVLNNNINTAPGNVDFAGQLNLVFLNAVPEPGSLALAGLALAGLGLASRRRKV